MLPVWLIEADVFREASEPLKSEIRRQGMLVEVVRHQTLPDSRSRFAASRPLPDDACVIFYGSLPLMQHIQLHRKWVPGGWCSVSNLACSAYYPHYGEYLLNQHYALLPGVEAIQQRDLLYDNYGRGGMIFARPNGVHKLFTGCIIAVNDFASALAPALYDPATRVLVAAPKPIACEWRLVVVEGSVVTASQYAQHRSTAFTPGCPDAVRAFADRVLHAVAWRPDPIFMLDICESEGQLFVLELNSFSCSGLYQCDLRAVVGAASRLAQQAWRGRRA